MVKRRRGSGRKSGYQAHMKKCLRAKGGGQTAMRQCARQWRGR